jgi:hypothetical protein
MTTAPSERFRSYMGPGDKNLPMSNEIQGYQPVSRIGEVVMNAFVDAYEHQVLKPASQNQPKDDVPAFYEWATVQPGMLTLARKKRTAQYRQFHAAETAMPVIGCAACLGPRDEKDFFFAGVCRSKTVRTPDDGVGPNVDEFFTLSLGGMVTLLNTSANSIFAGDLVEWTLSYQMAQRGDTKRQRQGPRRIGIQTATVSSPKIIGRALSFAKPGEPIDLLLKQ